jgi:hypothetical protein
MRDEPRAADAQSIRQQQLRIEPRRFNAPRQAPCTLREKHFDCVIFGHCSYYPRMQQPLYCPSGPQAIGQVLDNAFRIFQASLVKCLPYGILSMIVGQFANIVFLILGRPLQPFGGGGALWWLLYAAGALAALALFAALILRQQAIAAAQPSSAGREMHAALKHLPGLSVVTLLVSIVPVMGFALVVLGARKADVVLVALTLLLSIPATYLFTALSFSWHALLLTPRRPLDALRYSWFLVRGHWWRVSLIYGVACVVIVVFYVIAMVAVVVGMQFAGAQDIVMATAASAVLFVALGALVLPFFAAILLATFNDLRLRKGGADLERTP